MSTLQAQAIEMIDGMNDAKVAMVISFIKELSDYDNENNTKRQSFVDLLALRDDCLQYFDDSFDPKKALLEGLNKKYGRID